MPARSKRNENRVQKQSCISDSEYSPAASPISLATGLEEPPALSAFNSPALVSQNLLDAEPEDEKETRGKVQEDLEFTTRSPSPPSPPQAPAPLHHESESTTHAIAVGHTRAPVLAR